MHRAEKASFGGMRDRRCVLRRFAVGDAGDFTAALYRACKHDLDRLQRRPTMEQTRRSRILMGASAGEKGQDSFHEITEGPGNTFRNRGSE
jgi:hypothetical protein